MRHRLYGGVRGRCCNAPLYSIDEIERKIVQLKIEQFALEKEDDKTSKEQLKTIIQELKKLESAHMDLISKWQSEKLKITDIQSLKEKLQDLRIDKNIKI